MCWLRWCKVKGKSSQSGYTMSNPLWEYSLATYRVKEVAQTCLTLQDTFDMDVNLLLYAAWLAHMNRCLSAGHLCELDMLKNVLGLYFDIKW